jgi:hypothetical protein
MPGLLPDEVNKKLLIIIKECAKDAAARIPVLLYLE